MKTNNIFDTRAKEYDAWYDTKTGRTLFATEVECLKPLIQRHERPYLEIGVGSGRFSQALGIEYGADSSKGLLSIAEARGVNVLLSAGEKLPLQDETIGGVLIALALCFTKDPEKVLGEAWRVLKPGGGLVLGMILSGSPWADFYMAKGKKGHPMYCKAHFFSKDRIDKMLRLSGFKMLEYRSTLFQPPGQNSYHLGSSIAGYQQLAGFTAIGCRKG